MDDLSTRENDLHINDAHEWWLGALSIGPRIFENVYVLGSRGRVIVSIRKNSRLTRKWQRRRRSRGVMYIKMRV